MTQRSVSDEQAHSGSFSMKMTIDTSTGTAGCRSFMNAFIQQWPDAYPQGLVFSVWLFIPVFVQVDGWWQIWQHKVRLPNRQSAGVAYSLQVYNPAPDQMALQLVYKLGEDLGVPGPRAGDDTSVKHLPSAVLLPVGQWFRLKGLLRPAYDYSGRIAVWLGRRKLFDQENIITLPPDCRQEWSINNYGADLRPRKVSLYVDDVTVAEV